MQNANAGLFISLDGFVAQPESGLDRIRVDGQLAGAVKE